MTEAMNEQNEFLAALKDLEQIVEHNFQGCDGYGRQHVEDYALQHETALRKSLEFMAANHEAVREEKCPDCGADMAMTCTGLIKLADGEYEPGKCRHDDYCENHEAVRDEKYIKDLAFYITKRLFMYHGSGDPMSDGQWYEHNANRDHPDIKLITEILTKEFGPRPQLAAAKLSQGD